MKKKLLRICLILVVLALPALAWAQPTRTICIASSLVGNNISNDESVRASSSIRYADPDLLNEYIEKGRNRIKEKLWSIESTPEIIFLDGEKVFGLFDYNQYGSTIVLPNKTCVLIGPKGANVDVISHELAHADIAKMLGYLKFYQLPIWINEGVVMQVDTRKRYNSEILKGVDARYVTEINGSDFYDDETSDAVMNYAASKYLLSKWIEKNGADNLLTDVRTGKIDAL